jgi:hypothetical protein
MVMPSHFKSTSTQDQAIQSWRRLPMSVLTGKLTCEKQNNTNGVYL